MICDLFKGISRCLLVETVDGEAFAFRRTKGYLTGIDDDEISRSIGFVNMILRMIRIFPCGNG